MNNEEKKKELLALEEEFWKGDSVFYQQKLTEDCLMVFPDPVGVLSRKEIITSIAQSQRWSEIVFDKVRVISLSEEAIILTYFASAVREDGSSYKTYATSIYQNINDTFLLAFHQQTPTE